MKKIILILVIAFVLAMLTTPTTAGEVGRYQAVSVSSTKPMGIFIIDTKDGHTWLWRPIGRPYKRFQGQIEYQGLVRPGKEVGEIIAQPPMRAPMGAIIFDQSCLACHHDDKPDYKIGPGLEGLFKLRKLPVSGRPVTEENVRLQIKAPFKNMPAFPEMPDEQINALIEYLKTL